jgi:hypothetical protein
MHCLPRSGRCQSPPRSSIEIPGLPGSQARLPGPVGFADEIVHRIAEEPDAPRPKPHSMTALTSFSCFCRAATAAGSSLTLHPPLRQAPLAASAVQRANTTASNEANANGFMGCLHFSAGRPNVRLSQVDPGPRREQVRRVSPARIYLTPGDQAPDQGIQPPSTIPPPLASESPKRNGETVVRRRGVRSNEATTNRTKRVRQ